MSVCITELTRLLALDSHRCVELEYSCIRLRRDFQPKGITDEKELFKRPNKFYYDGSNIVACCRQFRNLTNDCLAMDIPLDNKIIIYLFVNRVEDHFRKFAYETQNQFNTVKDDSELPELDHL